MKLNFKWEENKYQAGASLHLNKIRLGSYTWNAMRPRGSDGSEYVGEISFAIIKR